MKRAFPVLGLLTLLTIAVASWGADLNYARIVQPGGGSVVPSFTVTAPANIYTSDGTTLDEWAPLRVHGTLTCSSTASGCTGAIDGTAIAPSTVSPTGVITMGADTYTGGYDIVNNVALTGDVAPVAAFEDLGGNASPLATTAGKQVGAASIFRGGLGTTALQTFVHANCAAGDAYTISGTDATGATITGGLGGAILDITAGGNWTLGADANGDATGFGAAITDNAYASTYITAVVSTNNVGIRAVPGKLTSLTIALKTEANGLACGTVINGYDGTIDLYGWGLRFTTQLWVPYAGIKTTCLVDTSAQTGGLTLYNNALCTGTKASISSSTINSDAAVNAGTSVVATTYLQAGTSVFSGKSYLPTVSAAATDTAPPVMVITAEEPYAATPPITLPTNNTGANIVIATPNGARRLGGTAGTGMCTATPCVFANGQTITIPVQVDGVVTNCVLTSAASTDAASRTFACDGLTPAVCGANVVTAASTVSPCSLMTVVAANNVVSFARKAGSTSYLGPVVSSAGGVTVQNGADGSWKAPVRVVAGANTACNTTCGAGRGCLFGQDTAALSYAIVGCADATADLCLCTAAQ